MQRVSNAGRLGDIGEPPMARIGVASVGTGEPAYEALLPNRLFRNNEGKFFQDVTFSADVGHLQKGHGVAFGDLRNNGQEDIFEVLGGAFPGDTYQSALFTNPGHANHWVTLQLEGVKSNRAAFGARISVKLQTKRGVRRIYRTVGYGSSFGQNPFRQHIGVGEADKIAEIEVTWPTSKLVQHFRNRRHCLSYTRRRFIPGASPFAAIFISRRFFEPHNALTRSAHLMELPAHTSRGMVHFRVMRDDQTEPFRV